MQKRWRTVFGTGLALVAVGSIFGTGLLLVVRAACATAFAVVGIHLSLNRDWGRARRPWLTISIGGAITLSSAVIRTVEGAIRGVSYPFPSVADLVAFAGFVALLSGATLLVRARTTERRVEDLVDAAIAALLAALTIYVLLLDDYLQDTSVALLDRLTNLGYSVLVILLVGVAARVSFGPGERNGSYYLLAGSTSLIVLNDTLTLVDIVGHTWAQLFAAIAGSSAFVFALGSVMHPGARRLADRPEHRDETLSTRRTMLLFAALVFGPALIALNAGTIATLDLVVLVGGSGLLAMCVLTRMVYLVRSREMRADREQALRELGTELVAATTQHEVFEVAVRAADATVADTLGPACAIFEVRADRVVTVAADMKALPHLTRSVAVADLYPEALEAVEAHETAVLELVPSFHGMGSHRPQNFVVVVPVTSQHTDSLFLMVSTRSVIARERVAALRSLADQLGLALDSRELAEQLHQQRSNQRFRALVENSSDVVVVVDEDAKAVFVSPTVRRLLGRDESDVLDRSFMELVHRVDQMHIRRLLATRSKVGAGGASVEVRLLHGSGELRWFEVEARDLSEDEEVRGVVITASDISDRKRAEAQLLRSEARFRLLVQNTSDVVAIVDENSMLTYVSPSIENMLGFATADVLGRNVFELLSITEAERVRPLPIEELDGNSIEVRIQGGDGRVRAVEVAITDMRDQPEVDGMVLNIRDVTERKTLEDDLRHQALHDELTGLGNRTLFSDRVRDAVASAARSAEQVAVLFVDLDDFKLINDSLGHVVGDQVLVSVAQRIQQCLRLSDVAARLGGDEFAILLSGVYGESEIIDVADRLRDALAAPITIADQTFHVTASIGIASDATGQRSGADLLRSADLAMYEAKEEGKNRHAMFADHMAVSAEAELELKSALVRAVENDEFVLHFQPIVDMKSRRIKGVEALIRWEDPKRGMVSPVSFIPAAEESGLITEIGMWVAAEAARTLAVLREQGHDLYCSINVSGRQMAEPNFARDFIEIIRASGVDSTAIVVELTESVLAVSGTNEMFAEFHEEGFRIALDDFGTGYSALQYLQTFDIDLIKIDRSFVTALGESRDSTMVRAVLDMAHSIKAQTIAEGIEDSTELGLLDKLGVDLGQGYYFARPVPVSQLRGLLENELAPDVGAAPVV